MNRGGHLGLGAVYTLRFVIAAFLAACLTSLACAVLLGPDNVGGWAGIAIYLAGALAGALELLLYHRKRKAQARLQEAIGSGRLEE